MSKITGRFLCDQSIYCKKMKCGRLGGREGAGSGFRAICGMRCHLLRMEEKIIIYQLYKYSIYIKKKEKK